MTKLFLVSIHIAQRDIIETVLTEDTLKALVKVCNTAQSNWSKNKECPRSMYQINSSTGAISYVDPLNITSIIARPLIW